MTEIASTASPQYGVLTDEAIQRSRLRPGVPQPQQNPPHNYEVTVDGSRHFAYGYGDDNPLYCSGSIKLKAADVAALLDTAPGSLRESRLPRAGEDFAEVYTLRPLNIRIDARALAGGGTGPEANVAKLLKAESPQHLTELASELAGPALTTGGASQVAHDYLFARCQTIAGGTSEIMRNTTAERILGLPRDPLIKQAQQSPVRRIALHLTTLH